MLTNWVPKSAPNPCNVTALLEHERFETVSPTLAQRRCCFRAEVQGGLMEKNKTTRHWNQQ
jgi:hypothetical protein